MSGGHFDYKQHYINDIADSIESKVLCNGSLKTKEQLDDENWRDDEWYIKYPEDLRYYKYPKEVIREFETAIVLLRKAAIYAQRIDWLLSGDDGDETFITRLRKDLDKL